LEVRFVSDYRSYKKFFFALPIAIDERMPLVLIDDDAIYPTYFLSDMLIKRESHAGAMLFYRAREILCASGGRLEPYDGWPLAVGDTPSNRLFATGVGGILLPMRLVEVLFDAGDRFLELCPSADDIWINYWAIKANIPRSLVRKCSVDFAELREESEVTLWAINKGGRNDEQIARVFEKSLIEKAFN
jgi:hypothetical protein